jgi:peroxidase
MSHKHCRVWGLLRADERNMGRSLTPLAVSILMIGILLPLGAGPAYADPPWPGEYRTVDGSNNNPGHADWGQAHTPLYRMMGCAYEDSLQAPPSAGLPSPRQVSNLVCDPPAVIYNVAGASAFLWQWGQFLDHDIDLTPQQTPTESFDIAVPMGDPFFDPQWTGTQVIPLMRSMYMDQPGIREQMNVITSFIDASNVYGSDTERARELRALDGTGRLKTSAGNLLPHNINGFPNAPTPYDPTLFLAGDVRANEQLALLSLHTLFMREHNYWAVRFMMGDPGLSGDEIYQRARAYVGAEMQVITYREFLPLLLGANALSSHGGYNPEVSPMIANEFSTGSYRLGHSMLPSVLLRLDASLSPIPEGHVLLKEAFFVPNRLLEGGIEPILRGLAATYARQIDPYVVSDVRNFLFGEPGAGGFDLEALNIQRGRDHGLPRYNEARRSLGLSECTDFADVSSDPEIRARLASAYASVEDIDFMIGGLAEDHMPGALVGELFYVVLKDQFERLRDGDRFWYQEHFAASRVNDLEKETLAGIIRRNTPIDTEIADDVFRMNLNPVAAGVPSAATLQLASPVPNPSRGRTAVQLTAPAELSAVTEVAVFNLRGERVSTLHRGTLAAGAHRFEWNRMDTSGRKAAAGVYFIRVRTAETTAATKLVLLD